MHTLIAINDGRSVELNAMLRGISQGSTVPDEIVIVNLEDRPNIKDDYGLNIKMFQLSEQDVEQNSYSCARNLGAQKATYDNLHFLNAECIPELDYFEKMSFFLSTCNGLVMGVPRYLYNKVNFEFKVNDLYRVSKHHYKRPRVQGVIRTKDVNLFWSLCFSVTRSNFEKLGGFDEKYCGYGAEDTDLATTCLEMGMPLYLSEAITYHQLSGFFEPPVDKIEPILVNCNYYFSKWGKWPMNKQLKAFTQQGYIDWSPELSEPIVLKSRPAAFSQDQFYINDMPYA